MLESLNPPAQLLAWSLRHDTTSGLWATMPRGDWAMWLLARCGYDRRKLASVGLVVIQGAYAMPATGSALVDQVYRWLAKTPGYYDWLTMAEVYRAGDPPGAGSASALAAFLACEHDSYRAATWLARVSQYVALTCAEPHGGLAASSLQRTYGEHARLVREQVPAADALAALEGALC